jgi:preprotein translocase subunit SecE
MSRISDYIKDTKGELKHVSWPSRNQTFMFTVLIIAVSIIVSAYLGLFDYLFSLALKQVI